MEFAKRIRSYGVWIMEDKEPISSIDSIAADLKENKMIIIGEMDAVAIAKKLKKIRKIDIVSIGPAKEEKKKRKRRKKKKRKKRRKKRRMRRKKRRNDKI
ncbi:hypothetical protein PVAP13_8NG185105 [Panicum virgatum]|uniref:Uncharacterized protein n=1 Tax=Panicum virgatum TaxID=38727 RepID=A0A8T0P5W2_PANVG|nr:hypothetical protein PVAP13_8NG185105 [Panicum virgatum]